MATLTNEELAKRIQNGERYLIKNLYENCAGYIKKTAAGVSGCRRKITPADPASTPQEILFEDLTQQAFFALNRAVEGFDTNNGTTFLVYFSNALKSEFLRYMAECGFTIRIPQAYRSALWKYEKAAHRFRAEHGSEPTPEDLAHVLCVSTDQARQLRDDLRLLQCGSLDAPAGEESETTLLDLQASEEDPTAETVEQIQQEELAAALWPIIDTLPGKRTAEVLRMRYADGMTYNEIAQHYSITTEMVRKTIARGLRELRRKEYAEKLRPYTDEAADILGHRSTGLGSFTRTGSSSVEIAVMHLNEMKAELARLRERTRTK